MIAAKKPLRPTRGPCTKATDAVIGGRAGEGRGAGGGRWGGEGKRGKGWGRDVILSYMAVLVVHDDMSTAPPGSNSSNAPASNTVNTTCTWYTVYLYYVYCSSFGVEGGGGNSNRLFRTCKTIPVPGITLRHPTY